MRKNFRAYNLAVEFYRSTKTLSLPSHLKEQLKRASSSIALNLAEGSARYTQADKRKFYNIAFSSLRECQAIIELADCDNTKIDSLADFLAANIYKLIQVTT